MKNQIKVVILLLISFIILSQLALAQDSRSFTYVISNSEDWRDVFSSIHYANLKGVGSSFLVSTQHGTIILNEIAKTEKIRVISSNKNPYVFNYPETIRSKEFAGVDEITSDNINLRLAQDLPEVDSYVVIGDSYGFDAIAVVPYAIQTKSWIFLANRFNINQIDGFLQGKRPRKILIYGYVDRQVRDALNKYNPEIIYNEDKFKDNIDIVKKFLEVKPSKQIILTNGEFIEKEIMNGNEPNVFTGKDNVPDQIRDYIKTSGLEVGVLIGNDLVGAATNIRRTAGISVMVKFARGARAQTGGVASVEGLDLFPLPVPALKLSISSAKYNKATGRLEITYKSDSNVPLYLKGTIDLSSGNEKTKVGDLEAIFVGPGEYKTIIYSLNMTSIINLQADITTLFGESRSALDRILKGTIKVESVDVLDKCKISDTDILGVSYNKQKLAFIIKIKNPQPTDCWFSLELNDITIGYTKRTLSTSGAVRILAGKTKSIEIKEELNNEDIANNKEVSLTVYSGEREDSLVNVFNGKFPLKTESLTILAYATIGLAILIIIIIIIIIFLKKRDRDDD